ncbi:MAG: hypothetical protein H0X25_22920 [Acidobacteriales bacterium]|nr:hypothetical protein [Terriglobales bacterium]
MDNNDLKTILHEIISDLEEIRVAVARRAVATGDQSTTRGEIAAGANREAYSRLRKRVDGLQ